MEWINQPDAWIALASLTLLEIVLGIDNIVFISVLSDKLPEAQRALARRIGLITALVMRLLLLFTLAWMMKLTEPLFAVFGHDVSGRDLILIGGGLFLLAKATMEMHDKLEGEEGHASAAVTASFAGVIVQIGLLDVVFSLDSVITAIGMADHVAVMVIAMVTAMVFMLVTVNVVADFIDRHPSLKMLALSFLLLIGMMLIAEGGGLHVPKGYLYFAMAFSLFVEILNIRRRKRAAAPVHLRQAYTEPTENE